MARWRAAISARIRERLTLAGFFFLLAMAMTGVAAFVSANNLLFLMLAAMLSILLVSDFVSRLGMSGLELDVQSPEHPCARTPLPARVLLRNEKSWFPSFSIHVAGVGESLLNGELYFPVIPGGAVLEESVAVRFARRGIHGEDSFLFHSRFPFGFVERRLRVTMRKEVLVYPALEPQEGFDDLFFSLKGEMESRSLGRGHDFYRIRPYEQGESVRHIDWKATAHTGSMQVREFAREQEPAAALILDLDCPAGQEAWFEHAIECAAYLAARLVKSGARIRFRSRDVDMRVPLDADLYAILKYLALVEPRSGPLPAPDPHENAAPLIFTAHAERVEAAGWVGARVVHPGRI